MKLLVQSIAEVVTPSPREYKKPCICYWTNNLRFYLVSNMIRFLVYIDNEQKYRG